MVDQPFDVVIDPLGTAGNRTRFTQHTNRIMAAGDVSSLRCVILGSDDIFEQGSEERDAVRIGRHYTATLEGDLLPDQGVKGQKFLVEVVFECRLLHGDRRTTSNTLEKLCVKLWTDNFVNHPANVSVDITNYKYVSDLGGPEVPVIGFPVDWRFQVAEKAIAVVLDCDPGRLL